MQKNKVLVITAHPDDAELLFGGTIHKYSRNGHEVNIIVVTNGENWNKQGIEDRNKVVKLRKKEAKEAAKILGISNISFLNLEDGLVSRTKLIPILVKEIRKSNPSIILSHSPLEGHYDHKEVSYSVTRVCNFAGEPAPIINPYWDSNEKPVTNFKGLFLHHVVNRNIDFSTVFISLDKKDITAKVNAVQRFKSQFIERENIGERLFVDSHNNGLISQVEYAEVFENGMQCYPKGKEFFGI